VPRQQGLLRHHAIASHRLAARQHFALAECDRLDDKVVNPTELLRCVPQLLRHRDYRWREALFDSATTLAVFDGEKGFDDLTSDMAVGKPAPTVSA
jgi:hypothetical protein